MDCNLRSCHTQLQWWRSKAYAEKMWKMHRKWAISDFHFSCSIDAHLEVSKNVFLHRRASDHIRSTFSLLNVMRKNRSNVRITLQPMNIRKQDNRNVQPAWRIVQCFSTSTKSEWKNIFASAFVKFLVDNGKKCEAIVVSLFFASAVNKVSVSAISCWSNDWKYEKIHAKASEICRAKHFLLIAQETRACTNNKIFMSTTCDVKRSISLTHSVLIQTLTLFPGFPP